MKIRQITSRSGMVPNTTVTMLLMKSNSGPKLPYPSINNFIDRKIIVNERSAPNRKTGLALWI